MIKVGIAGGAGYTGGELLRILVHHPKVEITFVHSKSNAGNPVYQVHGDLFGDTDIKFSESLQNGADVLFLCLGHGDSVKFIADNQSFINDNPDMKIIDLSQDFRPENDDFIYGLPELKRDMIAKANKVANPGCFATCIQLGLLPLAKAGLLNTEIHTTGITGSTGAGQKPTETTHFSWRNDNISVYKAFNHQHLKEINQSLIFLQKDFSQKINFIPYRGDFTRGIFVSQYIESSLTLEEAYDLYNRFYELHPFTHVARTNPDMKQVVNTNKCIVYLEKNDNKLMIITMIDNLIKGASGQAVQNMNLMFGLSEKEGLNLKSIGY